MTIEDRRDREKAQMKELILKAATQIIVDEGYDKLSIRKIANQIEYSPALIYHYFKNKNEVIGSVMREGYQNLISALEEGQTTDASAENRLKILTRKYIDTALQNQDQFMAVQLNKTPEILEFTSYLFEGASEKKAALNVLAQAIRDIRKDRGQSDGNDIEMIAQIIAAATLGLTVKLILEKNISEQRRDRLIDQFTEMVVQMASVPAKAEEI